MFRDSVRSFMQNEIGPHAERWREQGIVDREAFTKAGEQGLLLMWADEEYGGAGVKDFRYEQILMEENAHHGDMGFFVWLHSRLVGPYFARFGNEEQCQRFLPGCVSGESVLAIANVVPTTPEATAAPSPASRMDSLTNRQVQLSKQPSARRRAPIHVTGSYPSPPGYQRV